MANENNLPGDITESVGIASVNGVGQQPATLANLSLGNLIHNVNGAQGSSVSFQQSQNNIQAASVGKVLGMLTSLGPLQAMSAQQILTGNSVAEELSALKTATVGLSAPQNPLRTGGSGKTPMNPITGGNVYVKPVHDVNIVVEEVNPPKK